MKRYAAILVLLLIFSVGCIGDKESASALTYQDELDVSFVFNSSISLSVSSNNLVISDLSPGTYADSNIITVTASSNNATGYKLTATAGDGTTYQNTDLVDDGNSFTSLATSGGVSSMSLADASQNGRWGYSFSTDSGTTWRNANTSTGYSGLPYYTAAGKQILSANSNGTSSVQFKIGAKANTAQSAGTYRNVINFVAVVNPGGGVRNYAVNYNDTSGDSSNVHNMPARQTGIMTDNGFYLSSDEPYYLDGYDMLFHGWCTEQVLPGYECSTADGDEYYPGGFFDDTNDGGNSGEWDFYTTWMFPLSIQNNSEYWVDEYTIDGPAVDIYNTWIRDYGGGDGSCANFSGGFSAEIPFGCGTGGLYYLGPLTLTIGTPPSSCTDDWHWSADVYNWTTDTLLETYTGVYSEEGENSFELDPGVYYDIYITGTCGP